MLSKLKPNFKHNVPPVIEQTGSELFRVTILLTPEHPAVSVAITMKVSAVETEIH